MSKFATILSMGVDLVLKEADHGNTIQVVSFIERMVVTAIHE